MEDVLEVHASAGELERVMVRWHVLIDGAVVQVQVQELPGVVVLFVGRGHLEVVAEMKLRYLYH